MTIEKNKEWGSEISHPASVVTADSDSAVIENWLTDPDRYFVLHGGDLHIALGQPVLGIDRTVVRALPVDVLRVEIVTADNTRQVCWALSSVQIGSWRKRGRYVCVSNTGHLGKLQLAPRAHPNDGEMDVVTISSDIDWKQRFIAYRRAQLGTHLPHPNISVERGTTASWTRTGSREHLRIDGNVVASWNEVTVSIVPDALTVLV